MKLIYNTFDLSQLGEISVTRRMEYEGGEAPQRAKVTLVVTVDVFERSYADNFDLLRQAHAAVSIPNQVLEWTNDDTNEDYVNQTATLVSENFPEEWGTYFQQLVLQFFYYQAMDTSGQNLVATLQKSGSGVTLTFDNVLTWKESATTTRFDPKRKQRRETRGKLAVTGKIYGDTTQSISARRAALAASLGQFRTEMNGAEGTLNYGAMFSGTVRVDEFSADIDQAICEISYSFTADYTLFPNELSYATVEATAEEKDAMTGETFLTIAGKIQATDEATARTKLSAVMTTMLQTYGYMAAPGTPNASGGQQLEIDTTPNLISANEDGDTFTELVFSTQWRKWRTSNQQATFTKTGNSKPIPFGNVRTWDEGYRAERFDQQRSERRHATGSISAAGTWKADMSLALTDRRKQLLAAQRAMRDEVNGADGTLVYGDWNQLVRIEELTAKINQAETGIDWTFAASYSRFPNEGGYATVEFTVDVRDSVETGDQFLTFSGEILAPNGSLARAKLNALRTATLAIYGFTADQRVSGGSQAHDISANGDTTPNVPEGEETQNDVPGVSFLRLSFNEEYRRRTPGNIISTTLQISSRDDTQTGLLATTYSGTVVANGPTADAAMAVAVVRANVMGADKESVIGGLAFLKSQQITIERRQTTQNVGEEFLRVSFSFEYQSKLSAGRAYLEVNTQLVTETFGVDMENVTGNIIAADFVTAQGLYQSQVRQAYAGRLIRSESVTQSQVQAQSPGTGTDFNAQQMRLEFSFSAVRIKPAGKVGATYSISTRRNFLQLTKVVSLRGSLFAMDSATAEAFVTQLAAGMSIGMLIDSNRDEEHESAPGDGGTTPVDIMVRLNFDDTYQDRLTGVDGILEMRVTESVTYSSTRWSVQPLPFDANGGGGVSIPQPTGLTEGSRTVRGSVTAATKAEAEAWAYQQRALLTGDNDGGFYPQPPQIDTDYEFAPRQDGIILGTGANVQLYRVNFTFSEILPNYRSPV